MSRLADELGWSGSTTSDSPGMRNRLPPLAHRVGPDPVVLEGQRQVAPTERITATIALEGRCLGCFAAWKLHVSLYPLPSGSKTLDKQLSLYRSGQGSDRYPPEQLLPSHLIERVVRRRV